MLVCCRYGRWEVGVLTGFERWVVLLKLDELLMEGGRKKKGKGLRGGGGETLGREVVLQRAKSLVWHAACVMMW